MKLKNLVFAGAIGLIAGIIAVANRDPVRFSVDPFSKAHPALAYETPLYVLLFVAFVLGVLAGGFVVMLGRWKRERAKVRAQRDASGGPAA